MPLIDSLANIGLPRYLSAEEFLRVMDDNEVEAALVSATPACADLGELSRATTLYGDRLRVVGAVVGDSAGDRKASVQAQIDSGFAGIHLAEELVVEEPELLELIGKAGVLAFVTGSLGLRLVADALTSYLDRFPEAVVCAPAFGGVSGPEILENEPVSRLFRHPRFLVIFSGQGAFDQETLRLWVNALIRTIGWSRALWGSDFPQCLWRGESYISTTVWIDKIGLTPSEADREAFFRGNARRLLFSRGLARPRPLAGSWKSSTPRERAFVSLFPHTPIDLPEEAQHALLAAYLNRSGPGSYRDFIAEQLAETARRLKEESV
jgi:hypothetical protein